MAGEQLTTCQTWTDAALAASARPAFRVLYDVLRAKWGTYGTTPPHGVMVLLRELIALGPHTDIPDQVLVQRLLCVAAEHGVGTAFDQRTAS